MQEPSSDDIHWHLLSTKYPSIKSSIGSYTLNLAQGLARSGRKVDLWHSRSSHPLNHATTDASPLLTSHYLPSRWDNKTLAKLGRAMDDMPRPRRLFLQFDPSIFAGPWNLRLVDWLEERKASGDQIWLMLHKVFEPYTAKRLWLSGLQAHLQKRMLSGILKSTDRVFVPTPYWQAWVEPLMNFPRHQLTWLPMPSNVVWVENKQRAKNLRKAFAPHAGVVLGTFGSYHAADLVNNLSYLIPEILSGHGERVWLCLGRGSTEFAQKLRRKHPHVASQIATTGELDVAALSAHVQACDMMLQPYPLGVNSSRSSIMVGLSHGRPIVTTLGPRTEEIWDQSACVRLTPHQNLAGIVSSTEALIADSKARKALSRVARATYAEHFSLERCLGTLLTCS